jgi:DNA adenine methylase
MLSWDEFSELVIDEAMSSVERKYLEMKRSVINYVGGKSYQAKEIIKLMPHHDIYIEPMFGAGHVFFQKKPTTVEIINDIYRILYIFYLVIQKPNLFNTFAKRIWMTYSHEWQFHELVDKILRLRVELAKYQTPEEMLANLTDDDLVDIAWAFFAWNASNSDTGTYPQLRTFPYVRTLRPTKFSDTRLAALFYMHNRLRNTRIFCKDYREILEKENIPEALIYLDPPYVHETRRKKTYYEFEWTDEQHEEMVDLLLGMKAKVILSGYDNRIYDRLVENGWKKISIGLYPKRQKAKQRGEPPEYIEEFVWINYDPPRLPLFDPDGVVHPSGLFALEDDD